MSADRNLTERQKQVLLQVYESPASRRAKRRSVVSARKLELAAPASEAILAAGASRPSRKRPASANGDVLPRGVGERRA